MFSWRRLVIGIEPKDLAHAKRLLLMARMSVWICVVVFILVWYGVRQVESEINNCWVELNDYRLANPVIIGGFNSSDCYIDGSDYYLCDIDGYSTIT